MLEEARCPHCGADIPIDNDIDTIICPYCDTNLVKEKKSSSYTLIESGQEIFKPLKPNASEKYERTKDLNSNISDAFEYAREALWGKWVRWVILFVCCFFAPCIFGYTFEILKGTSPAPEPSEYVKMVLNGLMISFITLGYLILSIIVGIIIYFVLGGGFVALIIAVLISFVLLYPSRLLAKIAVIRFARSGRISSAFAIHSVLGVIKKIGWSNYLFTLIVIDVCCALVLIFLQIIPVIGTLASLFAVPFIFILEARIICNLYDSVT